MMSETAMQDVEAKQGVASGVIYTTNLLREGLDVLNGQVEKLEALLQPILRPIEPSPGAVGPDSPTAVARPTSPYSDELGLLQLRVDNALTKLRHLQARIDL